MWLTTWKCWLGVLRSMGGCRGLAILEGGLSLDVAVHLIRKVAVDLGVGDVVIVSITRTEKGFTLLTTNHFKDHFEEAS